MADKKEIKEDKNKKMKKNKDKNVKPANTTKTDDKIQKSKLPPEFSSTLKNQKIFGVPKNSGFSSRVVLLEPLTTEKVIRQIELENKIAFIVNRKSTKEEIKKELEATFKAKVLEVNTQIRNNKKIAFIKLKPETPAIDIATKLGLM